MTSNQSYFGRLRSELLELVPAETGSVLSVGCGAGVTEAELVKRGVKVVGLELDPVAAEEARAKGLEVVVGDADQQASALAGQEFDCLFYADVLEHLPAPEATLGEHVAHLKPGGTAVVSVPNFRNYQVFGQLFLKGKIRYEEAGILDRTHLRITTRKLVEEWFADAGLQPVNHKYLIYGRKLHLLSACSCRLLDEFLANQVVVVGRKPISR